MNNWNDIIEKEKLKSYYKKIEQFIFLERTTKDIYPSDSNIFKAFELTPFNNVKVVILGQDPYHEPNQACGLAFSVPKTEKIQPSLRNIYKELNSDLGLEIPNHGDLSSWAKEGVLLLNAVLTVEKGIPQSHHNIGWQLFTDEIIRQLNLRKESIVFILLGKDAQTKEKMINQDIHKVIKAAHPSPLSCYRGFFGSKIFSKTNEILIEKNIKPINWNIINEKH